MDISLITREYQHAAAIPSDINEHIPTLFHYATQCTSVVEAGVRYVVSTWAFLLGCACRGGTVTSYCWNLIPEIQRAMNLCAAVGVPWTFHPGDWLKQTIPTTDLLFIDTNHFYSQLTEELRLHAPQARKYIILHDTVTFGTTGADNKQPGLWRAVEEFLDQHETSWHIKHHYTNNNGLTVLEHIHGNP